MEENLLSTEGRRTMRRGLVIGKFYPFHRGHSFLIEQAKSQVDELTVIVCYRCDQTISGELRAQWIQEEHSNVNVLVVIDILDDENSKAWAEYTQKILGYVPDVVFSSEDYGEKFAKCLGCQHVLVDRERVSVPISGTEIRKSPLDSWDYLTPAVKAYYAKRICIIGAESTGTTTMAKSLAQHYETEWVSEFGRAYWEAKMESGITEWRTEDFVFIASEQNRMEDYLARHCNKVLICDTDSFATSVWHERYMGSSSQKVEKVSENRHYDLYLLTGIDIPFVQDGTRDGEHIREDMHHRFKQRLIERGVNFLELTGNHANRMKIAIAVCDKILKEGKDKCNFSVW
jgi:NadR type nicotinamide-nucleotide adenylyltransferase